MSIKKHIGVGIFASLGLVIGGGIGGALSVGSHIGAIIGLLFGAILDAQTARKSWKKIKI